MPIREECKRSLVFVASDVFYKWFPMSKDKPKQNLLSSKLDFEEVDEFFTSSQAVTSADPLSGLVFDSQQTQARKSQVPISQVDTSVMPINPIGTGKKTIDPPRMPMLNPRLVTGKQDRFTLYAVIIVLLSLSIVALIIYFSQTDKRNSAGLSYLLLPESIVSVDGVAARVQATIQVDLVNQEWLFENKKMLSDSFNKEMVSQDLESLRSLNGIASVQLQLKELLNRDLKTDKVEAVLFTELLVQDQL